MLGIIILAICAVVNGIWAYKFKYPINWFVCGLCTGGFFYSIMLNL